MDEKTLKTYNAQAQKYVDFVSSLDKPDQDLQDCMDCLPAGGSALDWGCGPANSTMFMRNAGFQADASDGSPEMAAVAKSKFDIDVRVATFDDLNDVEKYDGIFANFSLLHAPRADFPAHLGRAHTALKSGGVLHLGLKIGDGEHRDGLDRMYTYYQEDDLRNLVADAGFETFATRQDSAPGLAGTNDPFIILRARKTT
jgi:trans-aconitate methyltransferase